MEKEKFNQTKYITEYDKEHYSQFKVKLKKEEKKELDTLLEVRNISKAQFLRNAIKDFKDDLKMKKYLVISRTQLFEKHGEEYIGCGNTIYGHDYNEIFDNYEDAFKMYDSINLNDEVSRNNRYSDYKELYEFDTREILIEDVKDGDYNPDDMKLLKDEYSFTI